MISLKDYLLQESINEKYKLKALFVIGIPASGKSTIVGPLSSYGNIIDTDNPSELLAYPRGVKLTGDDEAPGYAELRKTVKKVTASKLASLIDNMSPIIATVVGDNIERTKSRMNVLKQLGYDVGVIWMDSDLYVAQTRAKQREEEMRKKEQSGKKVNRAARHVPSTYIRDSYIDLLELNNQYAKKTLPGLKGELEFFKTLSMDKTGNYPENETRKMVGSLRSYFEKPVNDELGKQLLDELKDKPRAKISDSKKFSESDIKKIANQWFSS